MKVQLPNGDWLELPRGATALDAAQKLGARLAKAAVAAKVNGKPVDLATALPDGATLEVLTPSVSDGLDVIRHSTAHAMAQAVTELFGKDQVRLGIGPVIEDGFYYDFDLPRPLTPEDLEQIEQRMHEIIAADLLVRRVEISREEAMAKWQATGDPYKVELIRDIPPGEPISFYEQQGNGHYFIDLCRGPHVPSTGKLSPHFKLLSVAGAYWRGDEHRPMLQRIYAACFSTKQELEEFLRRQEEIARRDHRKLGKALDIFSIHDEVGAGLILWHPKGA
ncbi:MAG: TGS domain-containing protein, partial [Deinococcus sp.]|nr:TGS domain-containing protein [Deinococcus sp.]